MSDKIGVTIHNAINRDLLTTDLIIEGLSASAINRLPARLKKHAKIIDRSVIFDERYLVGKCARKIEIIDVLLTTVVDDKPRKFAQIAYKRLTRHAEFLSAIMYGNYTGKNNDVCAACGKYCCPGHEYMRDDSDLRKNWVDSIALRRSINY